MSRCFVEDVSVFSAILSQTELSQIGKATHISLNLALTDRLLLMQFTRLHRQYIPYHDQFHTFLQDFFCSGQPQ